MMYSLDQRKWMKEVNVSQVFTYHKERRYGMSLVILCVVWSVIFCKNYRWGVSSYPTPQLYYFYDSVFSISTFLSSASSSFVPLYCPVIGTASFYTSHCIFANKFFVDSAHGVRDMREGSVHISSRVSRLQSNDDNNNNNTPVSITADSVCTLYDNNNSNLFIYSALFNMLGDQKRITTINNLKTINTNIRNIQIYLISKRY